MSLLSQYEFPGDDLPVVQVSALKALEGDEKWGQSVLDLMDAVDNSIPEPERDVDKPFLMPVEDVFTITGRGTVVTGRIERGILKVNEEIEIVGIHTGPPAKTTVTGVEMFRKAPRRGSRRRERRSAPSWHEARGRRARAGHLQAGLDHPAHGLRGSGLHPLEGRGRPSHAVLRQLPSAVLLPYDGRDGCRAPARGHRDGHARRQHRHDGRASSSRSPWRTASSSPSVRVAARSAPVASRRSSSDLTQHLLHL